MAQAHDRINATCDELRNQIADAVDAKQAAEARNKPLEDEIAALRQELEQKNEALREEQLLVGEKNVEIGRLNRECATLDVEGRKLRDDWDDKVYLLQRVEQEREYFQCALHALAGQYSDGFARLAVINQNQFAANPTPPAVVPAPVDWAVSAPSSPRPRTPGSVPRPHTPGSRGRPSARRLQ